MEEKQETAQAAMERGGSPAEDQYSMQELMTDAYLFKQLRQGDIVEGMVVSVSPTEILVDVGTKSEGIVTGRELDKLGAQGLAEIKPGNSLWVYVLRPEDQHGNLLLSVHRAEMEHDWQRAQEILDADEMFEEQVAGFNKGGLIVRLGKLRGFVPASQLMPEHQGSDNQPPEQRWARLVGQKVMVKIIELDRKRKRLILSERAAVRQWREQQKTRLLENLREGNIIEGVVTSLADFGAFVDLGGADGLIHLSELSWRRDVRPRDLLKVGQKVQVYVLDVEPSRKRIALSLKRLEPEPWSVVDERYYIGQLVEGVVTKLTDFGAFVLLDGVIEGMIHISELSPGRVTHPRDVVREGQTYTMRIIRIDSARQRMGLSLKRVADPEFERMDWRAELAAAEAELDYTVHDNEYDYDDVVEEADEDDSDLD